MIGVTSVAGSLNVHIESNPLLDVYVHETATDLEVNILLTCEIGMAALCFTEYRQEKCG